MAKDRGKGVLVLFCQAQPADLNKYFANLMLGWQFQNQKNSPWQFVCQSDYSLGVSLRIPATEYSDQCRAVDLQE
jgi:hypothetical protein